MKMINQKTEVAQATPAHETLPLSAEYQEEKLLVPLGSITWWQACKSEVARGEGSARKNGTQCEKEEKFFAQHLKFVITVEIPKKFLNYHLKTPESLERSARATKKAEFMEAPRAAARAERMAAAAKVRAKANQAAAAKAEVKAKAKAYEKEEMRLLAEAMKAAAKATKAVKAARWGSQSSEVGGDQKRGGAGNCWSSGGGGSMVGHSAGARVGAGRTAVGERDGGEACGERDQARPLAHLDLARPPF